LSFFNFSVERAIARETANGSPSGIATIKITIAIINTYVAFKRVAFENKSASVNIR